MYKAIGKTEDIGKLDDEDPDYERLTLNTILYTLRGMNLTKLNVEETYRCLRKNIWNHIIEIINKRKNS